MGELQKNRDKEIEFKAACGPGKIFFYLCAKPDIMAIQKRTLLNYPWGSIGLFSYAVIKILLWKSK